MNKIDFLKGSIANYKNLSTTNENTVYFADDAIDSSIQEIHVGRGVWSTDAVHNAKFTKIKTSVGLDADLGFSPASDAHYISANTSVKDSLTELDENLYSLDEKVNDLQLYKFPNATIFGNPTINNGQISNFSSDNYLQFPFVVDLANRPFVIEFCVKFSTTSNMNYILDSNFGLQFVNAFNTPILRVSSDGESWDIAAQSSSGFNTRSIYYFKISWDRQTYRVQYSLDKINYTTCISYNSTKSPYPKQIIIGRSVDGQYALSGILNFNYCSLTIDDILVWQGMDDVGLATRMAIDLSNIDNEGKEQVKLISGVNEKEDKPILVEDLNSTSITLNVAGNTIYKYGVLTALTIASIEKSDMETTIFFTTNADGCTLTVPNCDIIGELVCEADTKYVISIVDGVLIMGEIESYIN